MLIEEPRYVTCGIRAVVAALSLGITACSASPTTPGAAVTNTSAAPLLPGAYVLSVAAPDGTATSTGQLIAACPGAGQAGVGYMQAGAIVDADGAASRVRPSTSADGNFELRLVRGSAAPQFGTSVSGSIRGVVVNTIYSFQFGGPPLDARATFSGLAPGTEALVDAVVMGASVITTGTVSGHVAVGNLMGASVNCASGTVSWSLSRVLR